MSFLENENQMVIDAEYSYIGEQVYYADKCFAEMCDSNYLKGRFNQFYDLKPGDDDYIEWDEEA